MAPRRTAVGIAIVGAAALAAVSMPAQGAPAPYTHTASGTVFLPNPVQDLGDESLTDQKDADYPALAKAYHRETLTDLDGSGTLTGAYVRVKSSTGQQATSTNGVFPDWHRNSDQFEQVMGYYWVTTAQAYLQHLGFGSTLRPVNQRQIELRIDQFGGDNSFYREGTGKLTITVGKGGVDDAEDGEVIVHEYGHAVHDSQVPGFGTSLDAGSIGEAFGDYLAVTVGLDAAHQYGWPVRTPQPCVADWDSVSYTSTTPHCLRRLDTDRVLEDRQGEVHYDGTIWSGALWDIRQRYVALGLGTRAWDTTLVDSQFDYAPDTSFSDAARATYRAALARDGRKAADAVRAGFAARHSTF